MWPQFGIVTRRARDGALVDIATVEGRDRVVASLDEQCRGAHALQEVAQGRRRKRTSSSSTARYLSHRVEAPHAQPHRTRCGCRPCAAQIGCTERSGYTAVARRPGAAGPPTRPHHRRGQSRAPSDRVTPVVSRRCHGKRIGGRPSRAHQSPTSANFSSATSHKPWRRRRPSALPAQCRSAGRSSGRARPPARN